MAKHSKTPIPERDEATLEDLLLSQGFGTRRECRGIAQSGSVLLRRPGQAADVPCDDPDEWLSPQDLSLVVRGRVWPVRTHVLIMLNKPVGHECSRKPKVWPSVLSLLPPQLRLRDVQPIGRLDQDTTGLLLFTDDGTLIHRLTSPKHHVPKIYEVTCKHAITDTQIERLLFGVMLDDEPAPVRAAAAERVSEHHLRLTLTEGKYHQVKRMLAAVSNRVEGLHRSAFGPLTIPPVLGLGQWCWLDGWATERESDTPATDTLGAPPPVTPSEEPATGIITPHASTPRRPRFF